MDGKKSLIEKLGNTFEKAKSKLKYKRQESYSDWFINNSTFPNATAVLTTSSDIPQCSNSPLLPASQPQNLEDITLIWYDPRFGNTEDTKKTAEELREINNYVIFYSNQSECVDYIKSINNEKIFLITPGKASYEILPEINQLPQLDSIFIFCLKIEKYQDLLKKYEKIVGIYSERSDLMNSIKRNAELLQRQFDTFSFYDEHQEKATRDLSEESAEFLWFQLFKDVILRMSQNNQAKQQLIQFCCNYYRGNKKELEFINEFEHHYKSDKSIYWYTRQTFLYKLVNKALRTEDIEQLYIFRFFIADLSLNLAALYKKNRKKEKMAMLYRGLQLKIEEINLLKQHEGYLISTNGFLSTSRSKDVAMTFAMRHTKRTDVFPVLYEIECNVNEFESAIFADITKYSEFTIEQEVLFDLGSTFKIISVSEHKTLNVHVIKMKATDAGIQMAKEYIELNRKEKKDTSLVIMFGKLLLQMGKYDEALKYFNNLLNDPHGEDIARIYNEIGAAYMFKCELYEALVNFKCAYGMMMKTKPCRVKDSSRPLTNMASVFLQRGEYERSLDFYFQALEIRKKFYGKDHLYTAVTLNNIGNVYYKKKDYYRALMYHEKALEIRQKQLTNDHIPIATSFNNIGLIHWKMKHFEAAYDFYLKSLEIRKKLLPRDHHEIVQSLINIAYVLDDKHELDIALKYYSEALTIQKIDFDPTNREDLLERLSENRRLQNGDRVRRPEYTTELCCVERPRHNDQKQDDNWHEFEDYSVSERTSTLVNDVSCIHEIIEALKYCTDHETVLNLWKQKLNKYEEFDENHPYVQGLLWIMDDTIKEFYPSDAIGEEVLRFYNNALFILENSIPQLPDTENLTILCLDRIGYIHRQNNNFELALNYFDIELQLQQQLKKLPTEIAVTLRNIGVIQMNLKNYNLALTSFNDALKLFKSSSTEPNDKEVVLTLKRIDEAKEALESATKA